MRRFATFVVLAAAGGVVGGCGLVHTVKVERTSLADRCAALMQAAMPLARIDVRKRMSENAGVDAIVARVAGTRTDLPADTRLPRHLAIECTFYDNILGGFRWTEGGPPQ